MGKWMCKCGQENEGKFCVKCGSPKPEYWVCSCGRTNTSKFCVACGRSKADVGTPSSKLNDSLHNSVDDSPPKVVTPVASQPKTESTFSETVMRSEAPLPNGTVITNLSPTAAKSTSSGKIKGKITIGLCVSALILIIGATAYFMTDKPKNENNPEVIATNSADKETETTKENTTVTDTYYVVNCDASITLRDIPYTTGKNIAQIPLGKPVGFIERSDNGFYKINYDGLTGYALAQYLSKEKPALPSAPSAAADKNYALGEVALNDTVKDVVAKIGKPSSRQARDSGKEKATYDNMMEVIYANGRVIGLVSLSPSIKAAKGVHEGSSLSEVIAAYGNGYTKSTYDKNDLYEYSGNDDHGKQYILRFAVRQSDGRVDYISIRYAD